MVIACLILENSLLLIITNLKVRVKRYGKKDNQLLRVSGMQCPVYGVCLQLSAGYQ